MTQILTFRECVQCITVLKRLYAKGRAYRFDDFARETKVHTELTKAVDALGIAINRITDGIDERLNRMRQRQAA